MGAHNNFSPQGRSSYELANLTGCFSYMTVGAALQLDSYGRLLRGQDPRLRVAQEQQDGGRCLPDQHDQPQWRRWICAVRQHPVRGRSGDHHLRLARSFAGADPQQRLHRREELGDLLVAWAHVPRTRRCGQSGSLSSNSPPRLHAVVCDQAVDGVLPAIFEKSNPGYSSRILPAVEGCVYPLYFVKTGFAGCTLEQIYATPSEKRMFEVLRSTRAICCSIPSGAISLPTAASSSPRPAITRG